FWFRAWTLWVYAMTILEASAASPAAFAPDPSPRSKAPNIPSPIQRLKDFPRRQAPQALLVTRPSSWQHGCFARLPNSFRSNPVSVVSPQSGPPLRSVDTGRAAWAEFPSDRAELQQSSVLSGELPGWRHDLDQRNSLRAQR